MKKKIFLIILFIVWTICVFNTDVVKKTESVKASTVNLNKDVLTLKVGEKGKLKVKGTNREIKWSSGNKKIARVNKNGKILAVGIGKTIITARVGKKKLSCLVFVIEDNINKNIVQMCITNSEYIGDCLLFKMPNKDTLMIDTGEHTAIALESIKKSLKNMKINHIDYFIISHYHSDHVGNLDWFIANKFIDKNTVVFLPKNPPEKYIDEYNGKTIIKSVVKDCLTQIKSIECSIIYPKENQDVKIGDVEIEFFNTIHDKYYKDGLDYNMMSLCNYITYGNMIICCTGDLVAPWYLKYNPDHILKRCNILKTPHHGGHASLDNELMELLSPDICVTSMGNYYATSRCENNYIDSNVLLKNYTDSIQIWCENHNIPNYITGTNNSEILLEVSKSGYKIINSVSPMNR